MDYLEKARRVIELEIAELNRLLDRVGTPFSDSVEAMKAAIEKGRKIVIVGVGKSGNIGNKLAATLNSTGATATILNCQDALHGDLGLVDENDVVIALSYSGETAELLAVLPHLKRIGISLVAITGKAKSTLGRNADFVIDVNVEREACPLNLAPTSSTTNMLVAGDALAMVLLEARGFRKEDFANLHPGGSLGRSLLTRAGDIMRSGSEFVCLPGEVTVFDAIEKMSSARAGAVVVVNSENRMEGIFTQGDFARAFQSGKGEIADQAVANFMTRDPISVSENKLAAEVLRLLEDNRIDDLVVVNDNGDPVGMIDTQDLTRLQIL
ncbi:MAG: KpsF/GutQ family sugar-phosphate isomerase [Verrucomicrobiales bacterium]|nr:KpsF/GutQ family sugar-phosphate isomerase [Verrucomicrobiales bacterium]